MSKKQGLFMLSVVVIGTPYAFMKYLESSRQHMTDEDYMKLYKTSPEHLKARKESNKLFREKMRKMAGLPEEKSDQ